LMSERRHHAKAGDDDTAVCPIACHKKWGSSSWFQPKLPRSLQCRNYFC
jgi:hypothetical protein